MIKHSMHFIFSQSYLIYGVSQKTEENFDNFMYHIGSISVFQTKLSPALQMSYFPLS